MPGLGTTFGRGGATTAPQDLLNADAILIMGSNMAENHPVALSVGDRGPGKRSADHPCRSSIHAGRRPWPICGFPLRAGSDIVLLGALVRYVLENQKDFREYVLHYTNASRHSARGLPRYGGSGGLFSGWDADEKRYNPETWVLRRRRCSGAPGPYA